MFEGCFCAISATMCPLCEPGFSGKRGAKPVVCCVEGAKNCHDPGSNRGPLDLQSNALPTELSWHMVVISCHMCSFTHKGVGDKKKVFRFYRDLNSDRRIQSPEC